jgi:hypothetical protein
MSSRRRLLEQSNRDAARESHERFSRLRRGRLCRVQRELSRVSEHLYQNEVAHDDELQLLACRALDEVQQLHEHVRALESTEIDEHHSA